MKVSLNWLKEMVDLPESVEVLSELLTKAGVEVEGVERRGLASDKVVIAQVLEKEQHPNADRLSVCQVDDGSGQPRQIVCGAKNFVVGDKVPLALPGAVLPGDFKIKTGKLRGVASEGMMCSAKELCLAEDAEGLLILPPEVTVGERLDTLFPPDTVLEVEVTPNRPDLLSHAGMAREIATLLNQAPRLPVVEVPPAHPAATVAIAAPEACALYTARRVRGVKVGPSPEWLTRRLEAVGLRAINNIVDITNYVMLELGQPLHAFDLQKVSGSLTVREAKEGERLLALDGKEYRLAPRHLVIADDRAPLALAGIMGGEASGVTEATTEIVLESASFEPSRVRRTSRELGLSSDSSYRFERSVDPEGVARASARAIALILELAGGQADSAPEQAGSLPVGPHFVPFRLERCRAVLGANVEEERVQQILEGFGLVPCDGGWQAPSFRPDLVREIDLVEEIARVIGIEAIPAREQTRYFGSSPADRRHDTAMRLRRWMVGRGFREARNLTLISEKANALFPIGDAIRVRNPLSEDEVILRPSLIPRLLETVALNIRNGSRTVRLFEIGRAFGRPEGEERTTLAFVMTGATAQVGWRNPDPAPLDFFDLKGGIAALPLKGMTFAEFEHPSLILALEVQQHGKRVGIIGQLQPTLARELDATAPILIADFDLDQLEVDRQQYFYRELPRYPEVARDIALLAPLTVTHGAVEAVLRGADEPLLVGVNLFDLFTDESGEKIPADRKSLAYTLTYRSNERTLTADEVAAVHERLKARLREELQVSFRE